MALYCIPAYPYPAIDSKSVHDFKHCTWHSTVLVVQVVQYDIIPGSSSRRRVRCGRRTPSPCSRPASATRSHSTRPCARPHLACSYGGGENEKKTENAMERAERFKRKKDVRSIAPAPHTLTPARRWRGAGRGGTRATTAGPPPWTWPSRRDDVIIGGTVQGFESDSFLILVVRDERLGSIRFCL